MICYDNAKISSLMLKSLDWCNILKWFTEQICSVLCKLCPQEECRSKQNKKKEMKKKMEQFFCFCFWAFKLNYVSKERLRRRDIVWICPIAL